MFPSVWLMWRIFIMIFFNSFKFYPVLSTKDRFLNNLSKISLKNRQTRIIMNRFIFFIFIWLRQQRTIFSFFPKYSSSYYRLHSISSFMTCELFYIFLFLKIITRYKYTTPSAKQTESNMNKKIVTSCSIKLSSFTMFCMKTMIVVFSIIFFTEAINLPSDGRISPHSLNGTVLEV